MIIMHDAQITRSRFFRIHCEVHLSDGFRLFHLYGRSIDALSRSFIRLFQTKHIYFTGTVDRRSWQFAGEFFLALSKNFNYSEKHSKLGQDRIGMETLTSNPTLTPLLNRSEVDG